MFWELLTYLACWAVKHEPDLPRRHRRYLTKLKWRQRRLPWRRLPDLKFLRLAWMILSNVITTPQSYGLVPPQSLANQLFWFGHNSYHRTVQLNQMLVFDIETWMQLNDLKAKHLRHILPNQWMTRHDQADCCISKAVTTPWTTEMESVLSEMSMTPVTYGPTTTLLSSDNEIDHHSLDLIGAFGNQCAFMNFTDQPSREKKPIIFDTGASLAITYEKRDFDGPLTVPQGDLQLRGMANGLRIEGIGSVTWTFVANENETVSVKGMAYYVPTAKARLLSPQRLFDATTGSRGRYEGDHKSFRLYLDNSPPLIIEYDDRNSLPIGYAFVGSTSVGSFEPQLNLSIMDDANQNLTGGLKLLLHRHH